MNAARAALLALALAAPGAVAQPAAPRLALVIGNADYRESPLPNPVNDAREVASALEGAGFTVIRLENADLVTMVRGLREFGDKLKRGGTGLFFFAGHGLQVKGRNYLLPVGADVEREDEVAYQALDTGAVLEKLESAKTATNIVILDACRNNPFARLVRTGPEGLAPMDAPPGTVIAFATAPGSVASDGGGKNGLYTTHLVAQMREPGLKIEEVFKRARQAVRTASAGRQIPWENTSLEGDFYFRPPVQAAAADRGLGAQVSFGKLSPNAPREAQRPEWKKGERWEFVRFDLMSGEKRPARFEIVEITESEVRMKGGDRFDLDGGMLFAKLDGLAFEPAAPRFLFPMKVGAEAPCAYRIKGSKKYPDWTTKCTIRVSARQAVTVPAGTFDTFRIEVNGRYVQKGPDGKGGANTFRYTMWYAPAVKREVLREHESNNWSGSVESRSRFVLQNYTLK